jgi:uncharacterized membrane protein YqhA
MFKLFSMLAAFMAEMMFGKSNNKIVVAAKTKIKTYYIGLLLTLIMTSEYYLISKLYTVSVKYIALEKDNKELNEKADNVDILASKVTTLEQSLHYCIRNAKRK